MSVDRSTVHTFVTGSPALGTYPDAQWGRWDTPRRDLLAECGPGASPSMNDAIGRGLLGPDRNLTSPRIGSELWRGGAGFALLDWAFGTAES